LALFKGLPLDLQLQTGKQVGFQAADCKFFGRRREQGFCPRHAHVFFRATSAAFSPSRTRLIVPKLAIAIRLIHI
jgi:hypothetical protein